MVSSYESEVECTACTACTACVHLNAHCLRSSTIFVFVGNAAIITDGGPAQMHGLSKGDELLEVNGVDATDSTLTEVAEIIQSAGEHLTLVVVPAVNGGTNNSGINVMFGSALEEGLMYVVLIIV